MNKCVICGETVPEGRQVCGKCEAGACGASKAPPPTKKEEEK
jgi:predicted nucleic acid-binding Zn ribbon protein